MKSETIQIRVQPALKEKIKELAEKDHRSVGDYIKTLVKREIEKESR